MNKLILGILVLLVFPSFVLAHPGRTASDGCHYCKTNCDKWGVPEGERHCHVNRIEEYKVAKVKSAESQTYTREGIEKAPGWEYQIKTERIDSNDLQLNNNFKD